MPWNAHGSGTWPPRCPQARARPGRSQRLRAAAGESFSPIFEGIVAVDSAGNRYTVWSTTTTQGEVGLGPAEAEADAED